MCYWIFIHLLGARRRSHIITEYYGRDMHWCCVGHRRRGDPNSVCRRNSSCIHSKFRYFHVFCVSCDYVLQHRKSFCNGVCVVSVARRSRVCDLLLLDFSQSPPTLGICKINILLRFSNLILFGLVFYFIFCYACTFHSVCLMQLIFASSLSRSMGVLVLVECVLHVIRLLVDPPTVTVLKFIMDSNKIYSDIYQFIAVCRRFNHAKLWGYGA